MRIEKLFNALKNKVEGWSDLIIFNTCITGKGFGKIEINKAFKKLVDSEDYALEDKDEILEHSHSLASEPTPKNTISS